MGEEDDACVLPELKRCEDRSILGYGSGGGLLIGGYRGRRLAMVGGGVLCVAGLIPAPFGGALGHWLVMGGSYGVSPESGLFDGVNAVEVQ